jgi:D-alanyl-lipoteichoic acid acyltransferase DltB (MBOAT superfamily)
MLFNSFAYFVFLPLVILVYFLLPQQWRIAMLLAASCYFYIVFSPVYVLILGFTIVIDYYAGIYLEKFHGDRRRYFLVLSIIANVSVLAVFKYYNFINGNISVFLASFGIANPVPDLGILLPIGLSFHTFQAMSYTIEVYRGHQKAEHNFLTYALYVMFFPQLVAGPIERPQNMLHQFYEKHHFSIDRLVTGGKFIIWGLFKKVVIADRLAAYTDIVYGNPEQFGGSTLLLATFFFSFQIYCDFSGYSDIAIGSAHILGFRLMQNFNLPYLSRSISEFWKRWHISLSTWFSDYVYKPMGGSRVPRYRWILNIFTVFLVSGLWHGANWTYVVWGGLHGVYYLFEYAATAIGKKTGLDKRFEASSVWHAAQRLYVFTIVLFAWVFFRADNLNDAVYIVSHMVTDLSSPLYTGSSTFDTAMGMALILLLFVVQLFQYNGIIGIYFQPTRVPRAFRWAGYAFTLILIGMLGVSSEKFIYFQF